MKERAGGWAFASAVQFFVAQGVVQSAWTTPFSFATNYISDLGNTVCAPYPVGSPSYVCSPWHAGMNASFIVMGLSVLAGVLLLRRAFGAGWAIGAGLALVALAGPGYILVGVYPENVNHPPHYLGAALNFAGANLGLVVLGAAMLRGRRAFGARTTAAGLVGFVATLLLVTEHWLGLGEGGMERVAAYPLPLWMIVVGMHTLRTPSDGPTNR